MGNKQRKTGVLPAFLPWTDDFGEEEKGNGTVQHTKGNVKAESFPPERTFRNSD
ncbi:hypothetical protein [Angelakisella massiliensis]|uniref:hypothetical protein n=1 Tax=Angelakisella massiliensis TaxID=1871018 RepID=UPI00155EFC48|nr:hypothetical protein [Angelakisella massiliensis]